MSIPDLNPNYSSDDLKALRRIHRRRWRFLMPLTALGIVIWLAGTATGTTNGAVLLGTALMITGAVWLAVDQHRLERCEYERTRPDTY